MILEIFSMLKSGGKWVLAGIKHCGLPNENGKLVRVLKYEFSHFSHHDGLPCIRQINLNTMEFTHSLPRANCGYGLFVRASQGHRIHASQCLMSNWRVHRVILWLWLVIYGPRDDIETAIQR